MNVYKLELDHDILVWEDNDSMVVVAPDEDVARLLASDADNGSNRWLDPAICTVSKVDLAGCGVVLISNMGA